MDVQQALKKCETDLSEIMASIEAIKGKKFVQILSLHINYCTLVTLTRMLNQQECNSRLVKALQKTAVTCASSSLTHLCEMAGLNNKDVEEILQWGDRLQSTMNSNIKQVKRDA